MKKIVIFVDGSNLGAALKDVGWLVNYERIREFFAEHGQLVGSFYFTALPPRDQHSPIRSLTDRLQYNGWTLITKTTKTYQDNGVSRVKGNMDVEITVKALRMADKISDLILFSGDGDFRVLAEALQEDAVRVTAVSSRSLMSDDLRRQVDEFINLNDLRQHIELIRRT